MSYSILILTLFRYQKLLKEYEREERATERLEQEQLNLKIEVTIIRKYTKILESKISTIGTRITTVEEKASEAKLKIPKKERRLSITGEDRTPKTLEKQLKVSADKRSQFKRMSYANKAKSQSQTQESDMQFSSRLIEVSKFK